MAKTIKMASGRGVLPESVSLEIHPATGKGVRARGAR